VLALFVAGLALAAPASADRLISASPAPGSSQRATPAEIQLTFDRPLESGSGQVAVTGPGGGVRIGPAITNRTVVTAPLTARLTPGTYTVSWTVTFFINDVVSGSFPFTIEGDPPRATRPAPTTTRARPVVTTKRATPSATRTPTPLPTTATATPSGTSAVAATPAPGQTTGLPEATEGPAVDVISSTGSGTLPSPPVLWGIILILALVAFVIRRWRRGSPASRPVRRVGEPPMGRS
jgi:methionine-rich copper-binding protein CopC